MLATTRRFVLASIAPALAATAARANMRCIPDPKHGGELCKTFVDVRDAFQETYHARHEPAALWIACVAVVFASHGHVIQQQRIAAEAYGDFDKVPINTGFAVTRPLARTWRDDDGVAFDATVEPLFDISVETAFSQDTLISSLSAGDPVILWGGGHPVVLTALAYARNHAPPRLVAGFVFDPMPLVGPRALDIDEIVPTSAGGDLGFAARLRLAKV